MNFIVTMWSFLVLAFSFPVNAGVEEGVVAYKREDYAAAFTMLAPHIQDSPVAQNILGAMYFNGQGVGKDMHTGIKLFREAMNKGNIKARSNLGYAYYNGLGVEKNLGKR